MVSNDLKNPFFISALLCAFLFYSGLFSVSQRFPVISLLDKNAVTRITGQMKSSPRKISSRDFYSADFSLRLCSDSCGNRSEAYGILNVLIPSEMVEVFFPGKLYSKGFLKGDFLYEQGCNFCFTGKFLGDSFLVEHCSAGWWNQNFWGNITKIRALCRLLLKRLLFMWNKAGGFFLALLCGAREYTDSATDTAFKNAGLSHILALSGMHLSLFSGIALFLGNKIGRRKISFIIRITSIVLFVCFAGISPSLCRAFICELVLICYSLSGIKKPGMLVVLSLSFLIQCVIFPSHINNSGFILSYSALAGILLFKNFFKRLCSRFCPKAFSETVSASLGAQFFSAPISLYLFSAWNPLCVVSSVFVSPLVTIFIYAGLFFLIISLIFPPLAQASGIFMNILYTVIEKMVQLFASVPLIRI